MATKRPIATAVNVAIPMSKLEKYCGVEFLLFVDKCLGKIFGEFAVTFVAPSRTGVTLSA